MLTQNSISCLEEFAGQIIKAADGAHSAAKLVEDLVGEGELPAIPRTEALLQTKLAFLQLLAAEIAGELLDLSTVGRLQIPAR